MCDKNTIIECIANDSVRCIFCTATNNEITLIFDKSAADSNINANAFIQSLSHKLKESFSISNKSQHTRTNKDSAKQFKLASKKKICYKFASDKLWYAGKNGSFIWWADATSNQSEYGLIILKLKESKASADAIDIDDENETKTTERNRRPSYKSNDKLSSDKNWTTRQIELSKQCKCSFDILVDGSLQFHGNFWTGILANATGDKIDHFIEVYSSESIQTFRLKKNFDPNLDPVKADSQLHQALWHAMFHPGNEKNIDPKNLYAKQTWFMRLNCFKMDDPDEFKVNRSPAISTRTDKNSGTAIKRRAIGTVAAKCDETRLNIKVYTFYKNHKCSKNDQVGQPMAIIEDSIDKHNHDMHWGHRLKSPLPKLVKAKGKEYFQMINITRQQWMRSMTSYCNNNLKNDVADLPENKEIGWVPNNNDMRYMCNRSKLETLFRQLQDESNGGKTLKDQDALKVLIEKLKKTDGKYEADDLIHFQEYIPSRVDENDEIVDQGQEFLLVYQNKFMRDMFTKYGQHITGIDATYKLTKYGLKLYWLVALDNLRHIQPVGVFITQYETDITIEKCLQILKNHTVRINKQCEPKIWIGDRDNAQMKATSMVYPKSLYWLCILHVQRNFFRTGKSKCANAQEQDEVMDLLTKMMYTRSKDKCDQFQKKLLQGKSAALKQYLRDQWFVEDIKKKWCMYYRNGIYSNNTHTSNIVESFNHITKTAWKPLMKDKTVSELFRVLVFEMLPEIEGRFKIFQFCASEHWRSRPTFELPDALCSLPHNVLIEFKKEQTKASMIDSDKIKDKGNGCFEVPSSFNPETEVRIVDMKTGRCTCIIVTESRIICRHIWSVLNKYGESHNYGIEDVDVEWFITIHEVDHTYGISEHNKDNQNLSVSNKPESDIDMNEKKEQTEELAELPIPVSESKQNLHSAQGILSQIKTLESLIYSLKYHGDKYLQFRQSGEADSLSTQLNEMTISLMNRFPNDGDMPITGMEQTNNNRVTKKEAYKHVERLCADIPFKQEKGRPTKIKSQQHKQSSENSDKSNDNRRSKRIAAQSANN